MTLSALWSSEAVEAINVAASLFGINGILMHIIMYIHSNSTKLPFVQSRIFHAVFEQGCSGTQVHFSVLTLGLLLRK